MAEDGVSVSLARELNTVRDAVNANPFEHTLTTSTFTGHAVAGDVYRVQYHGFAHSHLARELFGNHNVGAETYARAGRAFGERNWMSSA